MSRTENTHKNLKIYNTVKDYFIFFDMEVLEDYYSFTYSKYEEEPVTLINPTKEEIISIINNKILVGYNCNNYDALILYALLYANDVTTHLLRKVSDNIIQSNMVYIKRFIDKNPQFKRFVNGIHDDIKVRFIDLIEGDNKYSLKNLDLYFNGSSKVFDFTQYTTYERIKQDNKVKIWEDYEYNDVRLLSQLFKEKEYKTFGVSYYELLVLFSEYIYMENNENIYFLSNIVNKVVYYLFFTKEPCKPIIENMEELINSLTEKNNKLTKELKELQPSLQLQDEASNKGGINYTNSGIHKGNIIDIDITSMYPNIMLLHQDKLSHFVTSSFKHILETRMELKHNSPSDYRVQTYKIALNSTFGNLQYKDENRELAIQLITKSGQHEILKLAIKLVKKYNCDILQVATDGIMAKYQDTLSPNDLLCYAKENSKLPIDETTEYNRVYIAKKNNYVAINDAENVYKGKGLFKLKKGLNTILPKGYNRYYPNWLLAKTFNIELPKVDYITNGIKGKIYGSSNNGLCSKMFQGKQYSTELNKELCIPSEIMSKYLLNESFLNIPKNLQFLVDVDLIDNIVRIVNGLITHSSEEAIINHNLSLDPNSILMVKPNNNLMIVRCVDDILFIDKRNIKWVDNNRKKRDKLLLRYLYEYFYNKNTKITTEDITICYGLLKGVCFNPSNYQTIYKLTDIIKDKEGLYE